MIWYVAAGGAVGSMSRYALGVLLHNRFGWAFPWATMGINIVGSFLLGVFIRMMFATVEISPEVRLMLTTGFCGGFTTFSAFSYENATLIQEGRYTQAVLYSVLSVCLSLVAVLAGFAVARYSAS